MIRRSLAVMAVVLLAAGVVRADVSYSDYEFNLLNHSGSPIANGTYVMLLDLNNDGTAGNGYLTTPLSGSAANWNWDANDLLLDRGQITNGTAYPFKNLSTAAIPASYTPGVDQIYVLWFDTAFNGSNTTGPGSNVWYGAQQIGVAGANPGDYGPFIPDGGSAFLKTTGGAVPEPATMALLVLGGGALLGLRRKRARA